MQGIGEKKIIFDCFCSVGLYPDYIRFYPFYPSILTDFIRFYPKIGHFYPSVSGNAPFY